MTNESQDVAAAVLSYIIHNGPQKEKQLVGAGLVSNVDDADAVITQLVEAGTAHWIVTGGERYIKAGR